MPKLIRLRDKLCDKYPYFCFKNHKNSQTIEAHIRHDTISASCKIVDDFGVCKSVRYAKDNLEEMYRCEFDDKGKKVCSIYTGSNRVVLNHSTLLVEIKFNSEMVKIEVVQKQLTQQNEDDYEE